MNLIRHLLALAGLLLALPLPAADYTVDQLMADLARRQHGEARFVETRTLALLDKPLVSSGELAFRAPDRLEKRTLKPKPEHLLLDGDQLRLEREGQKLAISLASQPEALAFVDSIRGTLTGNRAALEKNYHLSLSGNAARWTLTLLPSDPRIAALLQRITVSGGQTHIRSIEYLQADGDRALLAIEPLPGK